MTRLTRLAAGDGTVVSVDHALCSGAGVCASTMPELFVRADAKGWLRSEGPMPSPTALEEVADLCPWLAIDIATREQR